MSLKPLVFTRGQIGPVTAFDELAEELGHSATLIKQIANDNANARTAKAELGYKQPSAFEVGDRVVMRGTALYASGQLAGADCARIWTVIECECDLCEQATGRLVAVDQEVDGYGWRHIASKALRHYGQPTVDELTPQQTTEQTAFIGRGLQLGQRKAGR